MHHQQTALENIVLKEEIARHEQFLLFPQCFLFNQKIVSPFVHIFYIISLFAAELEEPKIDMSGKGLSPLFSIECGPYFNLIQVGKDWKGRRTKEAVRSLYIRTGMHFSPSF